jgi:hypothetical protein
MHLAGNHEIDLPTFHLEVHKINRMTPRALRKIDEVIERMLMRKMKVWVFIQIVRKTISHKIFRARGYS